MAGNTVQKSKPSHVSEAAPAFYKPGNLKAVASWNYVAYLYLRKVHLRYYVGSPRVEVGTVDFVTNNPGSLDYDPTSSLPALTEAGKHGAYPKNAEILSGPYRRFAVFPNEQIGIDAVIPALVVFGGKTGTVTAALTAFKGCEKDRSDAKLLGIDDPALSDSAICAKVKQNYKDDLRAFMKQALEAAPWNTSKTESGDEADRILAMSIQAVVVGSKEAKVITTALLKKEGALNVPGVIFEWPSCKFIYSLDKHSQKEIDVINELIQNQDAVSIELNQVMAEGPPRGFDDATPEELEHYKDHQRG